jgi:hypothetical protein
MKIENCKSRTDKPFWGKTENCGINTIEPFERKIKQNFFLWII